MNDASTEVIIDVMLRHCGIKLEVLITLINSSVCCLYSVFIFFHNSDQYLCDSCHQLKMDVRFSAFQHFKEFENERMKTPPKKHADISEKAKTAGVSTPLSLNVVLA